jgi:hypothetical protein
LIEDTLDEVEDSVADVKRKLYGVFTAQVINPLDPLTLGRVQVRAPFLDALDLQPWARVAVPMAGMLHGNYFIPNVGDEVLVAFEHGDARAPYIIGGLWTAMALPPLPTPLPQIRAIRTIAGNQIVFTELPPSVTIQTAPTAPEVLPSPPSPTGPHNTFMLSPAGITAMTPTMIQLVVGTTTILISPSSITLVIGSSMITMTPASIDIMGTKVSVLASDFSVTAGMIRLNS